MQVRYDANSGVRTVGNVLVLGALLVAAWATSYLAGGSHTVAPHLFYAPVLYAAAHRDVPGTMLTALAAGILCGPLLPLMVATGEPQPATNWVLRTLAFLAIGTFFAVLLRRLDAASRAQARADAEAARADAEAARADTEVELRVARQRERMLELFNHELRTPITIVRGSAELLGRSDPRIAPREAELVAAIGRASQRMESLATVVDAAADNDRHLEPREIPIHAVIEAAISELPTRGALDPRDRLRLSGELDTAINTSTVHLRTALSCVLDNALRFSPDDAEVELHVAVEPTEHDDREDAQQGGPKDTQRRHHERVTITVRDHGPGLPEGGAERLFEAFEQGEASLTRRYQGLGLGLYATSRLTAQLGGDVALTDATDGPGTVARIRVPRCIVAARGK